MLVNYVEAHASTIGDRTALRCDNSVFSYSGLAREVDKAVVLLRDIGVTNSSVISVYCENCAEIMVLYYAMAKIGGTFVPINAGLNSLEVAYILGHSGAQFLFSNTKQLEAAAAAVESLPCQLIDIEEFFAKPVSQLCLPKQSEVVKDEFLIIYTSGSTGTPKAVLYNQAAEALGNESLIEMWGVGPSDKLLVALPLGYLYGLSTAASMALQAGAEVIVLRRFHPRDVLEAIVEHRVTVFQGVPTMFTMMLEYAEQNGLEFDLSFMRSLISAGAPLSSDLRARFAAKFGKELEDYYALTEVRPVFGKYSGDSKPVPKEAIGKACPGVEVKVVDGNGNEVGAGVTGEILVRAPATTIGYFKSPELTAEAFAGKYFRTGDLGHRDADGFFFLTGRIKDIIIRGGANIAPAEVEDVVLKHPSVQSAAVIGIPDKKFGELPIAYLVSAPGHAVDEEALAAFCRESLAEFKVPVKFIGIDEMPLGNTGKIDKKVLRKMWEGVQQ